MALPNMQFDQTHRRVSEIARWAMAFDEGGAQGSTLMLDLDAPYQRGSVWTTEQRLALIKSLYLRLPIGAVFINHQPHDSFVPRVVDGKQRVEAIMAFMRDEFAIPTAWVDDREEEAEQARRRVERKIARGREVSRDDHEVYAAVPDDYDEPSIRFSQLTRRGQSDFEGRTFAVYETRLSSTADEALLFGLINQSGTSVDDDVLDEAAAMAADSSIGA